MLLVYHSLRYAIWLVGGTSLNDTDWSLLSSIIFGQFFFTEGPGFKVRISKLVSPTRFETAELKLSTYHYTKVDSQILSLLSSHAAYGSSLQLQMSEPEYFLPVYQTVDLSSRVQFPMYVIYVYNHTYS